jgi:hypothetical protein
VQINVTVEDIESIDLTTPIETRRRYNDDTEEYEEREVTIGHLVANQVTAHLTRDDNWGGIKRKFLEIRNEEIRKAVEPLVTEAISGPITKTNVYGEPSGETTTIRELIMAEAKTLLTKSADQYNRNSETVLQKVVREQISAAFTKELAAVLAEEKAKVVAAVRAKGAELIAEAVKQGLGVR